MSQLVRRQEEAGDRPEGQMVPAAKAYDSSWAFRSGSSGCSPRRAGEVEGHSSPCPAPWGHSHPSLSPSAPPTLQGRQPRWWGAQRAFAQWKEERGDGEGAECGAKEERAARSP